MNQGVAARWGLVAGAGLVGAWAVLGQPMSVPGSGERAPAGVTQAPDCRCVSGYEVITLSHSPNPHVIEGPGVLHAVVTNLWFAEDYVNIDGLRGATERVTIYPADGSASSTRLELNAIFDGNLVLTDLNGEGPGVYLLVKRG
jgi:hypothetical protein